LMSRTDIRLASLLRPYIDGIPLDLASRLLPRSTWLQPGLLTHVHLHGAAQKRYEGDAVPARAAHGRVSMTAQLGLIDSLEGTINGLDWRPAGTTWANYYAETNYSAAAMAGKRRCLEELLDIVAPAPRTVWDLGANTGAFSRIAAERGAATVAWDMDPAAVEKNYREGRAAGERNLLPLVGDLTNPSPDLGWANEERQSLVHRGPADVALGLALIHHLAIGNNVPLARIAQFLGRICAWAIVEFVPKSDSQVQRLLASREDIFDEYTREGFEARFGERFEIVRTVNVPDSERYLYLLRTSKS
ncbi:MAG TPA: class I SAM-dependent methyltransferase, partial [Chthonomonadaceae bacterium]|nr:class I SAM-dependent methyltransferase [Chthonomonadaceae bacterium]